jgi:uncharacterized membrane protein YfcA
MGDGELLTSLLAGSIPAVLLGSLLAEKVSSRWIQLCLALALMGSGLKVLL